MQHLISINGEFYESRRLSEETRVEDGRLGSGFHDFRAKTTAGVDFNGMRVETEVMVHGVGGRGGGGRGGRIGRITRTRAAYGKTQIAS